jgi:predicted nucleotidyltransferase
MEKTEKDYEELLRLLNKHKVRYCIVGAFAVAFYAIPRYTKDMDIFVEPSKQNANRILNALSEFGFESLKLSTDDFIHKGRIIQLGYEPIRVDVITSIEGCTFDEVWKNKKKGSYGKEKSYFIGLDELIRNKRSLKRKQDKADLEVLLAAKKRIEKHT